MRLRVHAHPDPRSTRVDRAWDALAREHGFTLVDLLVVIVIIGVLLAIAIPSYVGFRGRASKSAAAADVRVAVPALEAFYADNNHSYAGMTVAKLKTSYDAGIKLNLDADSNPGVKTATGSTYCVQATVAGVTYSRNGPGAEISEAACG